MARLRLIGASEVVDCVVPETPLPLKRLEEMLVTLLGSGDAGATECVDAILRQAVAYRASDIHVEPWDDVVALRYRIDGILHEAAYLPREHHARIVGRVKVLARIVTYQKDMPQDGRIDPEGTPCGKAMRVSTFPTVYGEKLVIRVLMADPALFALDTLGFGPPVTDALRALIGRPQGTLLLTGPSSSGKTTTIYALLSEILRGRTSVPHVVTIEDPVEYRLGRVAQTEVNPNAGFTFESALRAALRQDPEVIVLGEIRDVETARAAIQAGLTGHLVISTIHSGTAAGVFTRLLDMGIEPFLIASSVTGVLAQRLLRRNCPHCAVEYAPEPLLAARFGMSDHDAAFRRGAGCEACHGIGYHGRMAIGELLPMNERMAELILARARTHTLHEAASGMIPLLTDALSRVREGVTTLEEVKRVIPPPDGGEPTPQDTAQPAKSRSGGFGLIEIVVALAILAVGLIGTIQLYHFGLNKIRAMRESSVAARAVQNEIETLRTLPFKELSERVNAPFVSRTPEAGDLVAATPAVTIRAFADTGLRLKEVRVSLRWKGDNGRTIEKTGVTLIADKEAS